MKALIIALALANLFALALGWYFVAQAGSNEAPRREISPERVRLLPVEEGRKRLLAEPRPPS